jgi:hypothetical protein
MKVVVQEAVMVQLCVKASAVPREQTYEVGEVGVVGKEGSKILTRIHDVAASSLRPQDAPWRAGHKLP